MIRYWAFRSGAEESTMPPSEPAMPASQEEPLIATPADAGKPKKRFRIRRRRFFMLAAVILTLVLLAWWRWQKAWEELEKPVAQVASQPAFIQESATHLRQVATVEANRIPRRR
jgi:hypothetical protein